MSAKRLALDTNLLVLLVVGEIAPSFISQHRRLRSYSQADYELLKRILSGFGSLVSTPNALTEVSNLVAYGVGDPLRAQFMQMLGYVAGKATEFYVPTVEVTNVREFVRLGLADAAWLEGVNRDAVMLTDDQKLYLAALERGYEAYYFRQVREYGGMNA